MIDLEAVRQRNAERKRLREAATPGPAYAHNTDDEWCMNVFAVTTSPREPILAAPATINDHADVIALTLYQMPKVAAHKAQRWDHDANYIAHAYTHPADADVDALLAEVERLRAQVHECPDCGECCKDCACVRKRHDELLDAVTAERATVERLRAVLRSVEFGDGYGRCPRCAGQDSAGHAPGCELAAALGG